MKKLLKQKPIRVFAESSKTLLTLIGYSFFASFFYEDRISSGSTMIILIIMLSWGQTSRKPVLSLRLAGLFLLRLAERQFLALLFQDPPRNTRKAPQDETPNWSMIR